jgi:hypothetical protein
MPEAIPRPPWMYNATPYLQELYRKNKAQIDAQWASYAAQNPAAVAQLMSQSGGSQSPGFPPAGNPSYVGGNFPSGGATPSFDYGPTMPGLPGMSQGNPNSTPSGAMGGNEWWQQLILQGIPVLTGYLGARQQAGQAQNVQNAQREQRAQTLALASPERYLQNYSGYLGAFKESYRPWLVGEQDRAAIGEQTALQGFQTDLSRRGLSGSGIAFAGQSAIRTGRQAQLGENYRQYWTQTEQAARDAAGQQRAAEVNASLGAPYTYVPRPSPTLGAVQGLGDAYRDWLWLQGTQNNPFVSKKDQRNVYG